MKLGLILSCTALLCSVCVQGGSAQVRPVGCPNSDVMTKALAGLSNRNWDLISNTTLPSMWPLEIRGMDCNAGACQTLGREDRVINDECKCCELFNFQIDRDANGDVVGERLHTIIIHDIASNRNEIVMEARKFARALGLSSADVATIGRETQQKFNWEFDDGKQIALMEVEVTNQRQGWKLYIYLSRFPL